MTKLIPFLKNPRIATVNKWVYEERRGGNRTGRLFQKLLIKLVQNLTRYFSYIGRDPVLTKVLCSYHRNGLTIYFIYLKIGISIDVGMRERSFLRITVRRTCSGMHTTSMLLQYQHGTSVFSCLIFGF